MRKLILLALVIAGGVAPLAVQAKAGLKVINRLMGEAKYSRPRGSNAVVDTIMIHFTSDIAAHPEAPYDLDRCIKIFENYGVSAHYLIDRDGNVHRLVKEERAAFHAGKGVLPWHPYRTNTLNSFSIGIELLAIGTKEEMTKFVPVETFNKVAGKDIGFTDAQYAAVTRLIADIRGRWPGINPNRHHVIGHNEYAPQRRSDPGKLFDWRRIGLE
jgi:N-acetyl-anhydromuramyl-L-alanine amidase AmpD